MVGLFVMFWVRTNSFDPQLTISWLRARLLYASLCYLLYVNSYMWVLKAAYQCVKGVMNCLYSVWDICDDLIFRKVNESDASAFARLVGCCPPQIWGVIWLLISVAFFVGGILVGIVLFKTPVSQQRADDIMHVPT